MRPTIPTYALGMVIFVITQGGQKRFKARIEGLPRIYRLEPGLKGLPHFLCGWLHGLSPSHVPMVRHYNRCPRVCLAGIVVVRSATGLP
jgi:hypothetical protein